MGPKPGHGKGKLKSISEGIGPLTVHRRIGEKERDMVRIASLSEVIMQKVTDFTNNVL
jgi:hypothetical protein